MVKHSVIFKFKAEVSSDDQQEFFQGVAALASIPGVRNLEVMRQTSAKNEFDFGILMEFESDEIYQLYNDHPIHQSFIQKFWLKMVDSFLEIDYQPIK